MFGSTLDRDPLGHVSSGLDPALPNGTRGLIPPTEEIGGRGTRREIDGVIFEFVDAAGTEAPAEFMFYLPQFRALCTAEVATRTLHNALTLRGAKARDLLRWSKVINDVLVSYGKRSEVVFASHHWPTWGSDNVAEFLTAQRDVYRYIHDQTLRRAKGGATIAEAAEGILEPSFSRKSSVSAATTAPSITTPKPCTSTTSAGGTALRRTSISILPRNGHSGSSICLAERKRC